MAQNGQTVYLPLAFHAEADVIRTTACLQVVEHAYPATTGIWQSFGVATGAAEKAFEATIAAIRKKDRAALFALLKFPRFSPFVASGIPEYFQSEDEYYYLEDAWWCPLNTTEYVEEKQVAKVVRAPSFLSPQDLEIAKHELEQLQKIADGKSYLARRVLEWAKAAPKDERIPEALYIAAKATATYKYGCSGWDHDEEAEQAATKLLTEKYCSSPWAAKLEAELQEK